MMTVYTLLYAVRLRISKSERQKKKIVKQLKVA